MEIEKCLLLLQERLYGLLHEEKGKHRGFSFFYIITQMNMPALGEI